MKHKRLCVECGRRPVSSHTGTKCAKCIADYLKGLHRRREAELRLPPISCTRHGKRLVVAA